MAYCRFKELNEKTTYCYEYALEFRKRNYPELYAIQSRKFDSATESGGEGSRGTGSDQLGAAKAVLDAKASKEQEKQLARQRKRKAKEKMEEKDRIRHMRTYEAELEKTVTKDQKDTRPTETESDFERDK